MSKWTKRQRKAWITSVWKVAFRGRWFLRLCEKLLLIFGISHVLCLYLFVSAERIKLFCVRAVRPGGPAQARSKLAKPAVRPAGRPIQFLINIHQLLEIIWMVGRPSGRPPKETFHTGLRRAEHLIAQTHIAKCYITSALVNFSSRGMQCCV